MKLAVILFFLLGLAGCFENTGPVKTTPITTTQVLKDVSMTVIYSTYQELALKGEALSKSIDVLAKTTNDANLLAARQTWREARVPWELSEAFLFGPVMDLNVDANIDSWPLNQVDLENEMNGTAMLTKEYLDSSASNIKGFHTMEYLLFGDSVLVTAGNLTPRKLEYLKAASASLVGEVRRVIKAWDATGGDYLGEFQRAGKGSTTYLTEQQALKEVIEQMFKICDEVADGKIFGPFKREGMPNRLYEESRFSNNSTADFTDNMKSVKNMFYSTFGGRTGQSLWDLLLLKDPKLAQQVKVEIDSAISVTANLGVFGEAIFNRPADVEASMKAIKTLRATLACKVDLLLAQAGPCTLPQE